MDFGLALLCAVGAGCSAGPASTGGHALVPMGDGGPPRPVGDPYAGSTGSDPDQLKRYLAEKPENNIVVGVVWVNEFEKDGRLVDPKMSWVEAEYMKAKCTVNKKTCGGHAILLVGYTRLKDSDDDWFI